jgi:hypothetical protein
MKHGLVEMSIVDQRVVSPGKVSVRTFPGGTIFTIH